ncbi:MAG TPA: HAD-IA family hydrolase [Candidatus Binatia bacterium]|nr:HAD-IA family hydrolase [Candidatus Binatia bacterium]
MKASRLAFEHVAFDLDGTLVDSRADLAAAVNYVMRRLGLPEVPPPRLYTYVGEGARVLVERALGPAHRDRLEEGVALFMPWYAEHLLDATRPYPGMVEALAALAERGAALSVLTNKPVAMSRAILDGLGLSARFVDVIGGDSLPTRKPDPAGLERLRAATGTARDRMLLVGDSAIDVRTARAGGVAFCGVAWGLAPDALRAAAPERTIAHPAELVAVVERG